MSLVVVRVGALPPMTLEDAGAKEKVEAALPAKVVVAPKKERRLLIFDLNVGYGGHGSIPHANHAFARMGEKLGAWKTVVSRDPEVFRKESLKQFDAVFLNNTVGNLFTDAELRQNLADFVYGGGGLMGVHGTTVGFTQWPGAKEDWPEFAAMIGARGANHKKSDELVHIKIDDPMSPLVSSFPKEGFEYRDEFFRVHGPYSRDRLRVLMSIDTKKTDMTQTPNFGQVVRADDDYALGWVKSYGRGRVFYCTIAHNPYVFHDAKMMQFYLGAAQFVLGDLDAPTVPSAKWTEAVTAQENTGLRLGIEAYTFHKFTFFETIEKTKALGLAYVGGLSFQKVSKEIPKNFEPGLSDEEIRAVRLKLDEAGLRMLTYYIHDIPADEAKARKIFEFGKKIGVEVFMTEPKVEALDVIEKLADEYDIKIGLHNHDRKASPQYWHPKELLKVVEGRSKRLGAAADTGYWMRDGIDPVEGVRTLGDRLITLQLHDLNVAAREGHDVPWGTGVGKVKEVLEAVRKAGVRPVMVGLEYSYQFEDNWDACRESAGFFNGVVK